MNWKLTPAPLVAGALIVAGTLTAATATADAPRPAATPAGDPAALPLTVTPAWLAAHLSDPKLVVLHVGNPDNYAKQHIRGARKVTLADVAITTDSDDGLDLELPPPEDLRHRLEALGISNDSRVVVYFADEWVSPATRVVLTLDAAGLGAHTALLDGGIAAWIAAGQRVTDAAAPARTGKLAPLAEKPIVVDATTVVASLGKPGVAVIDARNAPFYDGTRSGGSPAHPQRSGHIAGALSIPYDSVFDDKNLLRSTAELQAQFAKAGVKPGDTVIGYCHIGQQATAMLFAARRLGYTVKLYDGSFEDWSRHASFPVEKSAAVPAPATPEAKLQAKPEAKPQAKPEAKPEAKP